MNKRDLHHSLRNEVIRNIRSKNAALALVSLQWGKDTKGLSLHVAPNTFTTAGIQVTDFLSYLGFERSECPFVEGRQCYAYLVNEKFIVEDFAHLFDQAYSNLVDAQQNLEACGFLFDQPEGWGYYFGKNSGGRSFDFEMSGDGHTAAESKILKNSDDDNFHFVLTWLKNNDQEKGWVIHYLPKHLPLSSEIHGVFRFLRLKSFGQCPQNEFEACNWKSIRYVVRPGEFFDDGNTDSAHR